MPDMDGSVPAQNWVDRLICFSVIRNTVLELVQIFLRFLWLKFWDCLNWCINSGNVIPKLYTESLKEFLDGIHLHDVIIVINIYLIFCLDNCNKIFILNWRGYCLWEWRRLWVPSWVSSFVACQCVSRNENSRLDSRLKSLWKTIVICWWRYEIIDDLYDCKEDADNYREYKQWQWWWQRKKRLGLVASDSG